MTTYVFAAACGALTLTSTMTLSAQTPAQPSPTTQPQVSQPTEPAAADTHAMTVTGCLARWEGGNNTSPADSTAKPGGTRYVLKDAVADSPMRPASSAGAAPPAMPQVIVVATTPNLNLDAHLNHKVRVTGTVGGDMAAGHMAQKAVGRPGESVTAGKAPDASGDKTSMTLMATSVAMVSATCTQP